MTLTILQIVLVYFAVGLIVTGAFLKTGRIPILGRITILHELKAGLLLALLWPVLFSVRAVIGSPRDE